jgi:hypothetical protein
MDAFFSQRRFVNDDIDIWVETPVLVKTSKGLDLNQLKHNHKKTEDDAASWPNAQPEGFPKKNQKKDTEQLRKPIKVTYPHKDPIVLTQKEKKAFYEDCRRLDNVLKSSKSIMKQIQHHNNQIKALFPEIADVHKKFENAAWNVKAYMKLGEEKGKPNTKFVTSTQEDDLSQVVREYKRGDRKRQKVEESYDSENGSIRSGSDAHFSDEEDEIESDSVYDPDNTQTQSTQSTGESCDSVVTPEYHF